MNQYMVEIFLPHTLTQEFMSLIPAQRAVVNRLVHEGTIRSYTLALNRSRLWVVMTAKDQEEVNSILDEFPIMPHSESESYELMFHDMASHELPRLSLN